MCFVSLLLGSTASDSAAHHDGEDDDSDWREAAELDVELATAPRKVNVTMTPRVDVWLHPTNDDHKWARQTVKHAGERNEGIAIYCYLHGCSRIRKRHQWPGDEKIAQWLEDGRALPMGEAGKIRHEAAFYKYWPMPE